MEKFKIGDIVMTSYIEKDYQRLLGHRVGSIGKIIKTFQASRMTFYNIVLLSDEEISFKEDELLLIKR